MYNYELKLFGPKPESSAVRPTLGRLTFQAANNLAAIEHARTAIIEALPGGGYARLHHNDGLIWEGYAGG
jgi:hypothetical protein